MSATNHLSFDKRKGVTAQQTRQKHLSVARNRKNGVHSFKIHSYAARVEPFSGEGSNAVAYANRKSIKIRVRGDDSKGLFARMVIEVNQHERDLFTPLHEAPDASLEIKVYGSEPRCIQTLWNTVDDWVIRSSNFHSLYELYGHFTEPHPIFSIKKLNIFSKHPIAKFALHAASFDHCSRYFSRDHLTNMFGKVFETSTFPELAKILRRFRFDIRCHETNIAIPRHVYMVAYPFTLPHRKQMNFSVKPSSKADNASLEVQV
jgi:DNA (cytosine-5)-methyltransferase 1